MKYLCTVSEKEIIEKRKKRERRIRFPNYRYSDLVQMINNRGESVEVGIEEDNFDQEQEQERIIDKVVQSSVQKKK